MSDGNLERAIALYHENGGADLGVSLESAQDQQRRQAEAAAARSSAQPFEDDDFSFNALDDGEVRKPIAQKHDVLVGGGDYYTDHVHHRDDYHDSAAMYGRGGEGSSGSSSRSGNRRTRNEDALRSAFTEAAACEYSPLTLSRPQLTLFQQKMPLKRLIVWPGCLSKSTPV